MEDLLDKDLGQLTGQLAEIQRRLEAWNQTEKRSRNLSLAITNLENTIDKMWRVLEP